MAGKVNNPAKVTSYPVVVNPKPQRTPMPLGIPPFPQRRNPTTRLAHASMPRCPSSISILICYPSYRGTRHLTQFHHNQSHSYIFTRIHHTHSARSFISSTARLLVFGPWRSANIPSSHSRPSLILIRFGTFCEVRVPFLSIEQLPPRSKT